MTMKEPLGLLLPADYAIPKKQGEQRSDKFEQRAEHALTSFEGRRLPL
jgi:hypothetical protein